MSFSQFPELCAHSGSVLPGATTPMTLRFTVEATAPKPQRDGAMYASCCRPALPTSDTTPPDRMTWAMVSSTRKGMAFSEVLTMAETSKPRHIEASESTAMPTRISSSGGTPGRAPLAGIFWPNSPISTSSADWMMLMAPSTISLDDR